MTKFIYPFFESIKLSDGKIYLLNLHKQRIRNTLNYHYPNHSFNFQSLEKSFIARPQIGLFKLRIAYNEANFTLEFIPYSVKLIHTLRVVLDNDLNYQYKYADRSLFTKHQNINEPSEEIIIIKNSFVTDSSYSNLVFRDGNTWVTPDTYILNGVKRQSLLKQGIIIEKPILLEDIFRFSKISLINALLDPGEIILDVASIRCNNY